MSVVAVRTPRSVGKVHVLLIVPKVEYCLLFGRKRPSPASARKRKGRSCHYDFLASHVSGSPPITSFWNIKSRDVHHPTWTLMTV
jgi:hypothetical protein